MGVLKGDPRSLDDGSYLGSTDKLSASFAAVTTRHTGEIWVIRFLNRISPFNPVSSLNAIDLINP